MQEVTFKTNLADVTRAIEAIEFCIEKRMESVGTSTDMYQRASVHTNCAHLQRIANELRELLK